MKFPLKKYVSPIFPHFRDATSASIHTITRDEAERDLDFIGILLFRNEMREESPFVMRGMKDAGINRVMITGDSVHTGIAMARQCKI